MSENKWTVFSVLLCQIIERQATANSCLFASHLSLNNGHTVICHSLPAFARRERSICASARLRKLRSPRMIYIKRWNKSQKHLEILIAGEEKQQLTRLDAIEDKS